MNLTGNTIFITGGNSGIGLGLAQRFAAMGNQVIVSGRRKDRLEQVAAENEHIDTVQLDVTDPLSIQDAFDTVTAKYPGLNVVINNAGIMLPEDLLAGDSLDVAESTVVTNLLGPIRINALFVPFLIGKPDSALINVTSGLAYVPLPMTPTYNATKAALRSLTESTRVQLRDTPTQVIELAPPQVATELLGDRPTDNAMPLEAFLDEVLQILETHPEAEQIYVERVLWQRNAEREGRYAEVLHALSSRS